VKIFDYLGLTPFEVCIIMGFAMWTVYDIFFRTIQKYEKAKQE